MPKFSSPDYAPLPSGVDFFYPKEIAAYLRCSLQTIYNLIGDGALKVYWVRGCYRIRREDFNAWFHQQFGGLPGER
jgi:excisionase family DNA binding protein